jgi:hypothetical protein
VDERIEKVTVGPDGITATIQSDKPSGICQCGHPKSFHSSAKGCQQIALQIINETTWRVPCPCARFVESRPAPRRRLPWAMYLSAWLIGAGSWMELEAGRHYDAPHRLLLEIAGIVASSVAVILLDRVYR